MFVLRSDCVRMRARRVSATVALVIAGTAFTSRAEAQQVAPQPPPSIMVTARGEVQATPDRARVQVGLETQARTASAASQENNRKQTAILGAIRALGIPAAQIKTLNYMVSPVQRWDEKERRTVIDGYRVSNIVQVETDKLEQAGQIIDAGLTNGANRVAGLEFLLKDRSRAEDSALTLAVESARRQAEVAARAAGGQVAELLELSIMEFYRPEPTPMVAMAARMDKAEMVPTPVAEGTTTVSVSISTRWRFSKP
jgi:uncharacterized protein